MHRFAMGKATISKHSLLPAYGLGKERVGYNSEHNKAADMLMTRVWEMILVRKEI